MKEIKQTYQVTKYQAEDGTIFDTKEECKKYDESAKCVLFGKYNDLVIRQTDCYHLCDPFGGSEDYSVDVVKVNTKDDVDLILQLVYFYRPYLHKEDHREREVEVIKVVNSALNSDSHILFIGRGYPGDEDFSVLVTKETIMDTIEQYCKEDEQIFN
jgi:hypothetical protein